jgi:hypothetical protein
MGPWTCFTVRDSEGACEDPPVDSIVFNRRELQLITLASLGAPKQFTVFHAQFTVCLQRDCHNERVTSCVSQ